MTEKSETKRGPSLPWHGAASQWEVWECDFMFRRTGDLQEVVVSGDDDGDGDFAYSR